MPIALLHRAAQVSFWGGLAFAFYEAVVPASQTLPLFPWDKAEHFVAFYVLTGLAVAAYPRRSVFLIGGLLSAFGALIEFVQAIPSLHRDADFHDWIADSIAICAALSPMLLVWWRSQFRESP